MAPQQKKRLFIGAGLALVAVCVALEGLVPDKHLSDPSWTVHAYHRLPGWNGLIGIAGCVVLVFASKALGKVFLQKREDFYDE